ncbi:MAG: flavodoxin domain-containing protein [Candidatus Wallbacteria bacterium]|nr:flavodoxin domain-containing protein [Candidatus Wallbacteria bacterium]
MPKAAVVFHSQTGWTRKVGRLIARVLDAEAHEIESAPPDIETYDLVVIGTPVHRCGPSRKVRNFLKGKTFQSLSFFCTYSLFGGISCLLTLNRLAQCRHLIHGLDVRFSPVEKWKKSQDDLSHKRERILEYVNFIEREIRRPSQEENGNR